MKHLKIYESFHLSNNNTYWKVKVKYLKKSLEKIGTPKHKIDSILKAEKFMPENIYIAVEYYPSAPNGIWTWDEDAYGHANYMGKVELTPKEIEEVELEKREMKYNI